MTVIGFDFSTYRIDWAWENAAGLHRRRLELGVSKSHIDRIQLVRGLTIPLDTEEACLEMPWGPNQKTTRSLMAVMGAITCRMPLDVRVSWIDPSDLRRAIGAGNSKDAAHDRLRELYPQHDLDGAKWSRRWDEHELDALVAAVGWTAILDGQE
jgi:hypothetical protein